MGRKSPVGTDTQFRKMIHFCSRLLKKQAVLDTRALQIVLTVKTAHRVRWRLLVSNMNSACSLVVEFKVTTGMEHIVLFQRILL